jgi:hypothetical protein
MFGIPTKPAAPGRTWIDVGREETKQWTYVHYKCKACRRRSVGLGEQVPSACCCQEKK